VALTLRTVVVADDHAPYRALVRQVLETAGFQVRAEVADAGGALQAVLEHRPGFALLDVRMPGGGLQAARDIKIVNPATFVVMITVSDDLTDLYEALRAGASGYVLKGGDPARLPEILDGVVAGEAVAPATLVHQMVDAIPERKHLSLAGKEPRLTEREWEVLELLADGCSTGEISGLLFVADVTVRTHVAAIVHKLGVRNRTEAATILLEHRRRHWQTAGSGSASGQEP
jgi:DNA-binding NarL/FixJ family response regulator